MGYQITIIASRRAAGLQPRVFFVDGAQVLQMPDILPTRLRNGGLTVMDLAGRTAHVARVRYDLVHAFEPRPTTVWPALFARRKWGSPYIAECDDLWGREGIAGIRGPVLRATLGRLDDAMEKFVWSHADGIAAPSTELVRRAQRGGLPHDRIRLVPVGADFERIVPHSKAEMRAQYEIPAQAAVVVHAGSTDYDAGLLAEVFIALAKVNPAAFLLMAGGQLSSVESRLIHAGLRGRWKHAGFLPLEKLGEVLACGDVALMPYSDRPLNRGRFPSRFGDYLAAGLPIATNPTVDAGRIVQEEGVGVALPEDPPAFAAGVHELMEDIAQREEMGRRARQLAETRYSWRAMAEELDRLFRHVLLHGRRRTG
jgi:glycosyltransferase involved in cell wall biosynthesis